MILKVKNINNLTKHYPNVDMPDGQGRPARSARMHDGETSDGCLLQWLRLTGDA
jgi:hypothetical protein